jgi:hypothetical protein
MKAILAVHKPWSQPRRRSVGRTILSVVREATDRIVRPTRCLERALAGHQKISMSASAKSSTRKPPKAG